MDTAPYSKDILTVIAGSGIKDQTPKIASWTRINVGDKTFDLLGIPGVMGWKKTGINEIIKIQGVFYILLDDASVHYNKDTIVGSPEAYDGFCSSKRLYDNFIRTDGQGGSIDIQLFFNGAFMNTGITGFHELGNLLQTYDDAFNYTERWLELMKTGSDPDGDTEDLLLALQTHALPAYEMRIAVEPQE